MLGMGWVEIFLVVIIALLAVGPEKLPDVARSLAQVIRQVQRIVGEFRETIDLEEFESQVRQSGAAHLDADVGHRLEKNSVNPVDKKARTDDKETGVGKSVNDEQHHETDEQRHKPHNSHS